MNVGSTANGLPGQLLTTLLEGQQAQTDLALKSVEVMARQQLALQQQQTAMMAVALMTGVGSKFDAFI